MLIRIVTLALVSMFIFFASEKGGNIMAMAKPEEALNTSIPPVDINIPAKIETATFALG